MSLTEVRLPSSHCAIMLRLEGCSDGSCRGFLSLVIIYQKLVLTAVVGVSPIQGPGSFAGPDQALLSCAGQPALGLESVLVLSKLLPLKTSWGYVF